MRIAIVTGASSGMGREFVKQISHFYKELDEIWVIARREDRLKELQQECQFPLRIFSGDLLKRPVYHSFKESLSEYNPDIRMLVNSAGFGKSGLVEDIFESEKNAQLQMIDLNCVALSRIIFYCLPYFTKGSRIINLASAAAFCPQPGFSVYAATKSYVLSFSRSLGAELKEKGIYVTAVCPGPVETEFFNTSGTNTHLLKRFSMADASNVVNQALKDSKNKKSVSIYGPIMKVSYIGSKLLPHGLIMKLF